MSDKFIGFWGTVAAIIPAGEGLAALSIKTAQREAAEQLAARHAAEATADVAGDSVSLYRGLHYGHPAYDDALNGIARPQGGHSNPALHNGGRNDSVFTSWTTDESIARDVASEGNGPGVVLRIPDADGPGYVRVPSPDIYHESEVLIRGPVFGAEVIR
ncbi:hypothetical protein AHiyo8_31600 [Arthrobacter sp. Hiyo8]|uniref:hypothetical protein n=1 Tax=Arthrobacter sp. Hiyo1 TaxID=1588020 RepID=UPI000683991E|nr:hypothetical protein [Arthrobacter sp. Hiyo1]BAS14857.1 hypothetical protein AHiyo8_31600 [Arthrobacter sp. Hiyo8]GAP58919.1 hypothetical protein AHiyo1_20910 [Arthrobacter sp. Hiyo1]